MTLTITTSGYWCVVWQRDEVMLEEEKELLEERVRELTVQLEQAQSSKVSPVSGVMK